MVVENLGRCLRLNGKNHWLAQCARRADTEQKYIVVFHDISIGCNIIFFQGAARQFKGPVTLTTMKVVVVTFSRAFIQNAERWMRDAFQPPVIHENLEIPINRCLVK